ncbi:hypothetical protein ACLB0R_04270 [Sphingomonas sp. GlSt437]|uniref:hypothetical protein n=1 Tax=Sphingomonas sp. GlSt437 TaxID=3389970 RepID=UPI003A84CF04
MRLRFSWFTFGAVAGALFVSALAARVIAGPSAPATIQQTMDHLIDPAADALWGSVGTIESARGEERRAPSTRAQWRQIEQHARNLIAGATLLQQPRLPVGMNGHGLLADADTPGIRTAAQIRRDIDANPAHFRQAAERLRLAGVDALAAARARSPQRLLAAGAAIDAACEACHSAYWYPRTPPLPLPSPDAFGRGGIHP